MEKSEIISRMMLILDLISETKSRCADVGLDLLWEDSLEKRVKPSIEELRRMRSRLRKGLKEYCGKDVSELRGTALDIFEVKIERRQKDGKEKD